MDRTSSSRELAELLGVSTRWIRELAREGVLPKAGRGQYPTARCVQAYVRYQAELSAAEPPPDIETARARKLAAQARLAELEVGEQERQLLPMDVHETRVASLLSSLRSSLLNVPGKWAPELVGLTTVPDATIRLRSLVGEAFEALQAIADGLEEEASAPGSIG